MLDAAAAFWLGILTSISPCPLASNIAALSFCLRGGPGLRKAGVYGTAYSVGRAVAYSLLAALIVAAGMSIPTLSDFLQRTMNKAVGPLLILTGAVLLDLLPFNLGGWQPSQNLAARLLRGGAPGSAGMGFLLALAFCPVSAALFFGALIPLTLKSGSSIVLPFVYGIATGLPVLAFALILGGGAAGLAQGYEKVRAVERWTRAATAVVLIVLGAYFTLKHVFRVL
jgi:cytochrome c biogenesis protein CcdA